MKNVKTKTERNEDIADSSKDSKQLRDEEVTMDLPDVKDIPGQEHIHPPKLNGLADTTISSDDEEGKNIPGLNDEETDMDEETSVTPEEKELLERTETSQAGPDDMARIESTLDNTDDDGELLNEKVNASGSDLDVPGSEDDDANEEIGEEDEENNSYSLGADKDD